MPRFIVERPFGAMTATIPPRVDVPHVRTFAVQGRTFDVYVAADRRGFRDMVRRMGIPQTRVYG